MICRIADLYFFEQEDDDKNLSEKLKLVLDDMLDLIDKQREEFNPYLSDAGSSDDEISTPVAFKLMRVGKVNVKSGLNDSLLD